MAASGIVDGNGHPVPDPSALTAQMITRELQWLREQLEIRIEALQAAQTLFERNMTQIPTDLDREIAHLRELHDERFKRVESQLLGIQLQFTERDTRTEQIAQGNDRALSATLSAAKEAVSEQNKAFTEATGKAEIALVKQLDQQSLITQTGHNSLLSTITDVKDRLTTLEGRGSGIASSWGVAIGILGVLGVVASLLLRR